jgi:hypothetical protein
MSAHEESYAPVIEEVAWKTIRRLKRKLHEAQKVASAHAPLVQPDAYYLTIETLEEGLEELKEKFPERGDRGLLEDFRAELVTLKKLLDTLVAGGTIFLLELAKQEREETSGRAGPEG